MGVEYVAWSAMLHKFTPWAMRTYPSSPQLTPHELRTYITIEQSWLWVRELDKRIRQHRMTSSGKDTTRELKSVILCYVTYLPVFALDIDTHDLCTVIGCASSRITARTSGHDTTHIGLKGKWGGRERETGRLGLEAKRSRQIMYQEWQYICDDNTFDGGNRRITTVVEIWTALKLSQYVVMMVPENHLRWSIQKEVLCWGQNRSWRLQWHQDQSWQAWCWSLTMMIMVEGRVIVRQDGGDGVANIRGR